MSNSRNDFYFNNFFESAEIACEAARLMKSVITDFDASSLAEKKEQIHEIEHKGDQKKHEMTAALVRAFITPLERDDIVKLSQNIDDVTDAVEDIIVHMYINGITSIRPDSIEFADIIINCCDTMKDMLYELRNFKRSKKLKDLIIELNRLEEVGDDMYMNTMRKLHLEGKDPLFVLAWREIYELFEKCCDACEDVADIVESITIGNT